VCSDCSKNKATVPTDHGFKEKKRVCDACFGELTGMVGKVGSQELLSVSAVDIY